MVSDEEFVKVYREESWDILLGDYLSGTNKPLEDIKQNLAQKNLSVKDTGLSYRLVNHWAKEGLIPDNREGESEKGWRKLCKFDLVWINALVEMRRFGLSISMLKKARETALHTPGKHKKPYPALEVGTLLCLQHTPVFLIIFSEGYAEIIRKQDLDSSLQLGLLSAKSYLLISLNKCCESVFKGNGKAEHTIGQQLDSAEIEAIKRIRSGDLESLEIIFKDGKVKRLKEVTKEVKPDFSLQGIVKKIGFGEIRVKVENGKIVLSEIAKANKIN